MTSISCNSKVSKLEKTPKVSVILTVKNEERTIGNAIESVLKIHYPSYEVILVDGGSEDRTISIAKQYGVKVIQTRDSTPGQGRNVGIRISSGKVIAFIDGDCYVARNDWLKNAVSLLRQDDVGGVGGPIVSVDQDTSLSKTLLDVLSTFFANGGSPQFARYSEQREVKSISSCNSAYRRDTLEKAGLYSGDLRFCEDADLNHRIRKLGYRLIYSPDVVVKHDWKVRSLKSLFQYMLKYGAGRAVADKKYRYLFSLFHVVPCLALICLCLLLLLSFVFGGPFIYASLFLIVSYGALAFISAFLAAYRFRDKKMVVLAPATYFLAHVGYALGFVLGLFSRDVGRQS